MAHNALSLTYTDARPHTNVLTPCSSCDRRGCGSCVPLALASTSKHSPSAHARIQAPQALVGAIACRERLSYDFVKEGAPREWLMVVEVVVRPTERVRCFAGHSECERAAGEKLTGHDIFSTFQCDVNERTDESIILMRYNGRRRHQVESFAQKTVPLPTVVALPHLRLRPQLVGVFTPITFVAVAASS